MMNFLGQLLDSFLPPHCWNCKIELTPKTSRDICSACWLDLFQPTSSIFKFERHAMIVHTIAPYEAPLKPQLLKAKFENEPFGHFILDKLVTAWAKDYAIAEAKHWKVVGIPTERQRIRKRKTDLPYRYAELIAKTWKCSRETMGLVKNPERREQKELSRHDRFLNLQNSFIFKGDTPTKKILLVDDIVTTGATLVSAMLAIREKHPSCQIEGFAVARTLETTRK